MSDLDVQLGEYERDNLQALDDQYDDWLRDLELQQQDDLTRDCGEGG